MKAHQSKRSDSGQILADAKQYISELKKQLSDALNASYEYEELRANDQNDISELKRQLADALAIIEELKADIKTKVCTTNTQTRKYRHAHAHKLPMCARTCTDAYICIYVHIYIYIYAFTYIHKRSYECIDYTHEHIYG